MHPHNVCAGLRHSVTAFYARPSSICQGSLFDAPREVILVINNDPCIDSPYGCDRLVRHLIPAGSRLTVYVRDSQTPNGARLFKVYDGTGKGIKP